MKKLLIFDVSRLLEAEMGTSEVYSFVCPYNFEGIDLAAPLEGKVEIMRIEYGFNAKVLNFSTEIKLNCELCLKNYNYKITFQDVEAQFYLKKPRDVKDTFDLYMVDTKNQQIDISELIRQEIILHFPAKSVCLDSCKGLCPVCGVDRNKKKCDCQAEIKPENPFTKLKDLLK
ncbi:DUF177 domain-containing protein [Patescibacteria group bacterium]|nr:DUF177 domain-containing protein [Patescibacteria group bacterium]